MSIISKETWEKFTEEEKEAVRQGYKSWLFAYNKGGVELAVHEEYEELFDKENLQSNPKIKTWKDVQDMNEDSNFFMRIYDNLELSDKVYSKCIATLKIAKLIELGYGGMVTEEEWKDWNIRKYGIGRHKEELTYSDTRESYCFVAFHTPEQREEFMSYPENVKLVEQYYMI